MGREGRGNENQLGKIRPRRGYGEGKFYAAGEENGCKLYDIMCDSNLIK